MASVVVMPRYGANMEEGTVASWSVSEGDHVVKDTVIAEIDIEKLSNELTAGEEGVILKLIANEGDTLPCGEPIAIIGQEGEDISGLLQGQDAAADKPAQPEKAPSIPSPALTPQTPVSSEPANLNATPKAIKLAGEMGIDIRYIPVGTGYGGMVTRADVRKYAAATPKVAPVTAPASQPAAIPVALPVSAVPLNSESRKMTTLEKTIAAKMKDSLDNTAQVTIVRDIDVTNLKKTYESKKADFAKCGLKLSYTVYLIKAVALALAEHPALRSTMNGDKIQTSSDIHIGIAIDIEGGLVVPHIKNAHQKDLGAIAVELADLAQRARSGQLRMDEISGGTFTISNLGMFGIRYFTPILNEGESAILGAGTVTEQPVVENGGIFVRSLMAVSLTHDHRIVNGAPAARFLQTVAELLSKPEEWV